MHSVRLRLLLVGAAVFTAAATAQAAPGVRPAMDTPSAVVHVDESTDARREDRHEERGTVVDAPTTHVDTRGPVTVDAPGTFVEVDRGSVHVEAPFVNLRIPR
jgi:hypothetical protein